MMLLKGNTAVGTLFHAVERKLPYRHVLSCGVTALISY